MARRLLLGMTLCAGLLLCGPAAQADEAKSPGGAEGLARSPSRVDFDERLVQGQTKKAEALYLFQRKDSEVRSMVPRRKSFRKEIIRKLDE